MARLELGRPRHGPGCHYNWKRGGYYWHGDRFAGILTSLPLADRRQIVGLEPARADVIVAGTLLTREIMVLFDFDELTASDGGLREGVLLHHLARQKGA